MHKPTTDFEAYIIGSWLAYIAIHNDWEDKAVMAIDFTADFYDSLTEDERHAGAQLAYDMVEANDLPINHIKCRSVIDRIKDLMPNQTNVNFWRDV